MDEENATLGKRLKIAFDNVSQENLLERPSPLGLRLTKTDSFLHLIRSRVSQQNSSSTPSITRAESHEAVHNGKVKASNFSASLLRIGSWERVSRHEGDLVGKFYFAKHKLVWEVLDGSLKSKIEFQSSEITALKATLPEDGPGTLDIVLARPPLFFKERNPQPKKHTVWKATSDFTGGEASRYWRHFLQCPKGSLNVHFEKLIRHDAHLRALSEQPAIIVKNPYFDQSSHFEGQDQLKDHFFDNLKDFYGLNISEYNNPYLCLATPSVWTKSVTDEYIHQTPPDNMVWEGPSHSSDIPGRSNSFKSDGFLPSTTGAHLTNLVDNSGNIETLEDLRNLLMNDFHVTCAADERFLMSKVSSLCDLLQVDPASIHGLDDFYSNRSPLGEIGEGEDGQPGSSREPQEAEQWLDASPVLMRHLPRAASLPRLLSDDKGNCESDE